MSVLLDGYRTLELLGKGAHSEIYEVVRMRTGEHFALKHVVRSHDDHDRFLEQTLTDFAVSHAVRHPNLRASYELHRKRQWIRVREIMLLMEYVPGQTLEVLRGAGIDDWDGLMMLFGQVIEGLEALHAAGYIHADMKPNNIIVTAERNVKIIDFGQSCHIGTRKERVQGTPDFIAPEQVARRTLDQRTDVFNLGATLYWTLTGKTYPTDQRLLGPVRGHDITDPDKTDPPHVLNPAVPPGLSKLAMDCCRQSPGERPPDMRQLRGRLTTLQNLQKSAAEDAGARTSADVGRRSEHKASAAGQSKAAPRAGASTPSEPFDGRDFE